MFQRALKNLLTLREQRQKVRNTEQPEAFFEDLQSPPDERLATLRAAFYEFDENLAGAAKPPIARIRPPHRPAHRRPRLLE